jgi:hypothetical protein
LLLVIAQPFPIDDVHVMRANKAIVRFILFVSSESAESRLTVWKMVSFLSSRLMVQSSFKKIFFLTSMYKIKALHVCRVQSDYKAQGQTFSDTVLDRKHDPTTKGQFTLCATIALSIIIGAKSAAERCGHLICQPRFPL